MVGARPRQPDPGDRRVLRRDRRAVVHRNTLGYSPVHLTFATLAISPWVIAAAVIAREVSIWTGLAIAARGRRVKARNVEARATFDREQEAKRAEYAGTVTV